MRIVRPSFMIYKNNLISLKAGYRLFAAISTMIVLFILSKQIYENHIFLKSDQDSFYSLEANKIQMAINDGISYAENCSLLVSDKIEGQRSLSKKDMASLLDSKSEGNNDSLINNIAKLAKPDNHKIKEYLDGHYTEYLVLNSNFAPIVSSNTQMISTDLSELQSMAKNLNLLEGKLPKDFAVNNVHFRYYKKDLNYEYIILTGISDESRTQLLIDNLKEHASAPFFLLIGFSMILFFFSSMMLNPITLLSRNALDIASGKKTKYKPEANTEEAAAFSQALDSVETSLKEEKNKQHNLLQQSQKLEKTLSSNNEFINNLSHEVRIPIHGISALSMGLVENWDKLEDDNAHKLAIKIAANSQRLLSLVSNILDIAKVQYGDMSLNLQNISLNTLIQEMVEECRSLYLFDRDIKIQFDAKNDIVLQADPDKITQVLRNIISNAIKVTSHGTITISWKRNKNNRVSIVISDDGVGIPDIELKSIFESFNQSSRTKDKISGIGLGLSISHKIIEAHGGEIWAENNKTKGASFIFTLPIKQTLHAEHNKDIENKGSISSSKANLMVIDDDDACLLSAEMISHNTNYHIFSYADPMEALDWLSQHPDKIDIIMIDMMIPEMSGIAFLSKIKSNTQLAAIPVVLQSGTSDDAQIKEAFENGAVGFIQKPYNREAFVNVVEKNLRK